MSKNVVLLLGLGAVLLLVFWRRPQAPQAPGAPLTSPPPGTLLDRLFPWFQSQPHAAPPNIKVSGVQRDPIGGYISAGGKALADLVRTVADVWPRQRAKAPTVAGSTAAPAIVPLTSTGGSYYDWGAFDAFLTGTQGGFSQPIDRPNYVMDWNRMGA